MHARPTTFGQTPLLDWINEPFSQLRLLFLLLFCWSWISLIGPQRTVASAVTLMQTPLCKSGNDRKANQSFLGSNRITVRIASSTSYPRGMQSILMTILEKIPCIFGEMYEEHCYNIAPYDAPSSKLCYMSQL